MLLICPECESAVQDNVKYCPGCGCPMAYIKDHQPKPATEYSAYTDPDILEAAATQGNVNAMYWLGYCLYYGENEFDEDENRSKELLSRAAQKGHSQAKADLQAWFGHVGGNSSLYKSVNEPVGPLKDIFDRFDSMVVFDLETSGLNAETEQIIEMAAIKVVSQNGQLQIVDEVDEMVALPFGQRLSAKITELTGITDETLRRAGKPQEQVCRDFMRLVAEENVLMVAYNAQFDMCFLGEFLRKHGHAQKFQSLYALDAMTVFKDRREYPHKLADAIEAYHLGDSVENSHHAIDDAKSLLAVLQAMDKERPDLIKYINLFGYNPKYGINGKPISGITYKAQPYGNMYRLYEN